MSKPSNRDDFKPKTVEAIAKRAAYICSNPDCRSLTLSPSDAATNRFMYVGKAAHITAAAPGGARYVPSLTPDERSSVENGIFLCSNCADRIDKNQGVDFPVSLLKRWKDEHEQWVIEKRYRGFIEAFDITIVAGAHHAEGVGKITGIDAQGPVIFSPGTKSTASGIGNVTATRIGKGKEPDS